MLLKVIPISILGIFSLGLLFGDIIYRFDNRNFLFLSSFIMAVILLFLKIRWKYIFLGICFFPGIHLFIENQKILNRGLVFSENDYIEYTNSNQVFLIKPIKEVKRNFWEVSIGQNGYFSKMILKIHLKSPEIPEIECPSRYVKYNKNEFQGEYFDFLKDFSNAYLTVYMQKCRKIGEKKDFRRVFKKEIQDLLDKGKIRYVAKDIAMGLIFGDSSYLNSSLKSAAREGGILHLFAASGLHIGILTGFLLLFCKKLPFLNYYTEKIIPILIGFVYLWMLNFPVSLSRAFIFTFIATFSKIVFRKSRSSDMVIIASTIICIFDHSSYLSLSFLLSFGAVSGILFLKEPIEKTMFGERKSLFIENLTLSISASIGTFPSLVYWFKSFSFGSIFINLILVPLTGIILPLLYLSLLLEFLAIPILKDILWIFSDILLHILAFLATYLGDKIGFYREFENILPVVIGFLIYILILFICIIIAKPWKENLEEKRRWKESMAALISIFSFLVSILCGIFLLEKRKNKDNKDYSFAKQDFYMIFRKGDLFMGGDCNYKGKYIFDFFRKTEIRPKNIHIENENCLQTAIKVKNDVKEGVNLYNSSLNPFATMLNINQIQNVKFPRSFEGSDGNKTIFFAPHKDNVLSLSNTTSKGKGKIILQFAYKSRDTSEDWNRLKSVLGIGKDWVFILPEELGEN
ncbi:MAG: ComEC/Rec2 family competence protein [Leptospiraceae bacterium]|nr:ComEC/Rec2 family competence protein [Leptospiraceae bacterium]